MFVALGMQHAKRMRHIAICSSSGSKIFSHIILCVSYDFHNKQRLFSWTAWTGWSL